MSPGKVGPRSPSRPLAALQRAVDEWDAEAAKYADDPASLALLHVDSWEHPHTDADVARIAVDLTRKLGGRPPRDADVSKDAILDQWARTSGPPAERARKVTAALGLSIYPSSLLAKIRRWLA